MVDYKNTRTISDLMDHVRADYGDRNFLRYEEHDEIWKASYRSFISDVKAMAAWTADRNREFGYRVKVGLIGSSSRRYLAVFLGVMSQGSVAVPLDVQLDVDTFCDNLNRSDVDILFYDWEHQGLVSAVPERCPKVRASYCFQHGDSKVPRFSDLLLAYWGKEVPSEAQEDDLAMILFTSGTTGKGKGVMLSQRNLIDNVFCNEDSADPAGEVYMSVLPIHHVFAINSDVMLTMRSGAELCLSRELARMAEFMPVYEPTTMRVVPAMAKALYNRMMSMRDRYPDLSAEELKKSVFGSRIRRFICGGGYMAPEFAKKFWEIGIDMQQGYGMSECSPKIAVPDWSRHDKVSSLGHVVNRCEVKIVDGEIWVKSPSVMVGYYKDPEMTAETLTPDGWLKTGDMGYLDGEGFLFMTGRKKNLIILSNGENVAPEELENLFADEPLVQEILVFDDHDRIAAEVYPNFQYAKDHGIPALEDAVREAVQKKNTEIPTFKRISKVAIRDIPFEKTSSKKIKRLQFLNGRMKEEQEVKEARRPENELQEKIYDIVSHIIGHSRFGIDTDLLEAGLDSMGSILMLTDFSEQLSFDLSLEELMANASVLKLEKLYGDKRNISAEEYPVQESYPLSNLQLYFAYVMRGNTTSNLPFFFKLDPQVDLQRLQRAMEDLFDRHPAIKDIIQPAENGMLRNFRDDSRKAEIPIVKMNAAEWEKERKGLVRVFTYTSGELLYHAAIYQTEAGNFLFFDLAHVVGDGMTMNILFEDLNKLYLGVEVPREKYSFYEHILDEKKRDAAGGHAENEAYYTELFRGFRIRKSILARKDGHDLDHGNNSMLHQHFYILPKKEVLAFCRKYGISENVLFLSAFNYTISIFSNENDVLSSSIHSGRTEGRLSRVAGALFLTYSVRTKIIPHETVEDFLKRMGRQVLETMHCYISQLHYDEMFFQYQGDILEINTVGGFPAERQHMKLDSLPFHLMVFTNDDGYYYELRYWENRFDTGMLRMFMTCFEAVVAAMFSESSVRKLRRHLPDGVFPRHFMISAGDLNHSAGKTLVPVPDNERVKVYVMNNEMRKKPFGAWGDLYVMDVQPAECTDQSENPYGEGILYRTGRTARILPDGTVDFLEDIGRNIVKEGITGRDYLDLYRLEKKLESFEGITQAEAYVEHVTSQKELELRVDLTGKMKPDEDILKAYVEKACGKAMVPDTITFRLIDP